MKEKGSAAMEWWEDLYNRQIYFDLYEEGDTRLAEQQVQQVLTLLHPPGGANILDLCCGYGRHSIKLAQRGFQVTGIDISEKQIQHARDLAQKAHVHADFRVADARKLNFQEAFDVVLNMFISFGFSQDENEHKEVLRGVFRALKPGGTFLLDLWNREKEIRQFQPLTCEKTGDLIVVKEWQFDALGSRINWRNTVIFPDGKRESWEHSTRAYTVAELKALLEEAGLQFKAVYGSLAGEEYTLDSPSIIIIATKP
jgi:2-polyprenyl-3-methyl-5-hydroxy-6-metoxy-1,4-benzoquinol methylase